MSRVYSDHVADKNMDLFFRSENERIFWENVSTLSEKYGIEIARKIIQRISELVAAEKLADLPEHFQLDNSVSENNKRHSILINEPMRLIFELMETNEAGSPNAGIRIVNLTNFKKLQ